MAMIYVKCPANKMQPTLANSFGGKNSKGFRCTKCEGENHEKA